MRRQLLVSHRTKALALVLMLTFYAPILWAQQPLFNLQVKNADLKQLIQKVESISNYSFIYGEDIKLSKRITLNLKRKNIHEILFAAFKDTPISYKIEKKHILLWKKEIKPIRRKYTISGYITDGTSSETLIGANIFEIRHSQGSVTNPYGFYSITLPEGDVSINYSYIGYATQKNNFILQKDTMLNIPMKSNNQLEEVVIISNKTETGLLATQMGSMDIPLNHIKNTPSFLGEADVLKSIQLLPGVQAGTEGTAGMYVRGGGPDENLYLLDGVPLYNVEHLFGFFSVFTPEAVKKVSLFKSSFPARFGGRLSSVVDVRTNDGDMKTYHGSFSIGLLSSKINFEGPIIKNKTAFNISARRSYVDILSRPFMPKDNKFYYYMYDVNAKINHRFNDKSRLFLSVYNGMDKFYWKLDENYSSSTTQADMGMKWGSTVTSLRWNYIFNNKLFSNTTVAYNNFHFNLSSANYQKYTSTGSLNETDYKSNYKSGIKDISYNIDFDYSPTPRHNIKFGGGYLYHTFRPEVQTSRFKEYNETSTTDTIYNNTSNRNIYAHEASIYIEDNFEISKRIRINAGLHLSLFNVDKSTYISLQPRLSMRYQMLKNFAMKASFTKMNQYIHLLSNSSLSLPTDLWVPVTDKVKPMQAYQYSVGGYYTGIKGWELSVEGYYKDMHNVVEYKDGASFLGTSKGWEDKIEMGKGRSFGLEFMAQKTMGKTTGWISYTLAKADRKFAEINNNIRFPYKYDRRHNINLTVNHKFNERIDVSASWVMATGGVATVAEQVTTIIRPAYGDPKNGDIGITEENFIESRNNYRLPISHRLNVGVNFRKKTKHGERIWNVSLYNAYNAMNPSFVYKKKSDGEYPVFKKITILPCIPSFSYTYKF